jgi:hypothetical protein
VEEGDMVDTDIASRVRTGFPAASSQIVRAPGSREAIASVSAPSAPAASLS